MAKMSSFKLKQNIKRVAATFVDSAERKNYLRMMIESQKIYERSQNLRSRDRSAVGEEAAAE
jgi:hypothetical protein